MSKQESELKHWFVMRDLSRSNAKTPAYKLLATLGMEVFTPMQYSLKIRNGKRIREYTPYILDLLFVYDTKSHLDTIVNHIATLQYRYQKGKPYCTPMTVSETDMKHFIHAIGQMDSCQYYLPDELNASMIGKKVRIIGGHLNGYEGYLLKARGKRNKRILVELPSLLVASVEVFPEYIQLI